jgi:S-layer protein (TIGR01567 family)
MQPREFDYQPWGNYFVISFIGATWFAGYDTSLQGKIASKSLLEEECLGRVLLDTQLQGANISEGNYTLEEGYEIRISDLSNDSLFLQLLKGGSIVDNWVVESNATYIYRKDLENVKNMPIIIMQFGNVFHNGTHSFAALDGIFQISDRYILPINPGTGFGELVIVSVQPDHIILVNYDPINLNRDSIVNIGPQMDIHVADNDTLRYYLNTSVYVVPSPKPPMIKTLDNVPSSASANFSMTIRAAEIRKVQVQILDSTNRTVFIRDITNLGQGSGDLWDFNWKWNATTMMLSDDRSLVLDVGGNVVPGLLYLNSSTSPRQVVVKFTSEGRISAIMDSVSAYYVSRGEYKQLNSSFDYDAMLANNTIREQYLKIEPGKSILQFINVIDGKFTPSKVNHTLQGNFEALQPHIIAVGAKPGRYELQVRVENAVNALSTFGEFFNVTNTEE